MKQAKWFVIIIIAVIIVFDIYLIIAGKESISNMVYIKTRDYRVFMAAGLILIGHLFWPNNPRCPDCERKIK